MATMNLRKASTVTANDRFTPVTTAELKHMEANAQVPVLFNKEVDPKVIRNIIHFAGHKGNVLLEDVKPGQRVLLNVSHILDQPFLIEPLLCNLRQDLQMYEDDVRENKDALFGLYGQLRKQVLDANPTNMFFNAAKGEEYFKQIDFVLKTLEMLVALRQLLFDEPIPLIDMESVKNMEHSHGERSSDTKARKIEKPSKSGNTAEVASSGSIKSCIPVIVSDGKEKKILAGFQDSLWAPDRVLMPLIDIINVDGWLVTSEAFLLKSVDMFMKRKDSEKPALQHEYRETRRACGEFINQEGTDRSENEWRQFITNCVHLHSLRHVLHDKPLRALSPKRDAGADRAMNEMMRMVQSNEPHTDDMASKGGKQTPSKVAAGESSAGSKSKGSRTKHEALLGTDTLPCMDMKGDYKIVLAGFPEDFRAPDRLVTHLSQPLNIKGCLVMSQSSFNKTFKSFKARKNIPKPVLQQEFNVAIQACKDLIERDGTIRVAGEWRQFISNCVKLLALEDVLHGMQVHFTLRGQDPSIDYIMDMTLQQYESKYERGRGSNASNSGGGVQDNRPPAVGEMLHGMSFEDVDKLEDITVFVDECAGIQQAVITDGPTLKCLRERAEDFCHHDMAAAKMYYAELTKSCKKTWPEVSKLHNMIKIGVKPAMDELQSWMNDCLYWMVLRRVLHDVPIKAVPGRLGAPVGGGVKLPGEGTIVMHV